MIRTLSAAAHLVARAKRLQAEAQRAAIPSLSVTRAAAGIDTAEDAVRFHGDVMVDLLGGALTPREARGLTRAVEERRRGG